MVSANKRKRMIGATYDCNTACHEGMQKINPLTDNTLSGTRFKWVSV